MVIGNFLLIGMVLLNGVKVIWGHLFFGVHCFRWILLICKGIIEG